MRRREFIAFVGGIAGLCPFIVRAQATRPQVVGFLGSAEPGSLRDQLAAFRRGLEGAGFLEGKNVYIEYRFAENDYGRLPTLAAELVDRQVEVIVASGGPVSALAARSVTKSIPIVFTAVAQPMKIGLVESFSRPNGNVTGIAALTSELDPKRLELLCELVPTAETIGALANPHRPNVEAELTILKEAAGKLGRQLLIVYAASEHEIEAAFETLRSQRIGALVVTADPFFANQRAQLVEAAAHRAIPAIYQWREFCLVGGLLSYGPSLAEAYGQAGIYTGRILRGASPSDLPVIQPTKFDLVINLKTAKSLGVAVPAAMLTRADEVIE